MVFKLSAYRVDWPPEAGAGRNRFYGVDDSARMEMHVRHGENFKPKIVPLFQKDEPAEKAERDRTITFSHMEELARFPVKDGVVDTQVFIDYTNYRGERDWRLIDCANSRTRFGTSKYRTEPQWLMTAMDVAKGEEREFAVKDIHETRKAVTTVMSFQLKPQAAKDQPEGTS